MGSILTFHDAPWILSSSNSLSWKWRRRVLWNILYKWKACFYLPLQWRSSIRWQRKESTLWVLCLGAWNRRLRLHRIREIGKSEIYSLKICFFEFPDWQTLILCSSISFRIRALSFLISWGVSVSALAITGTMFTLFWSRLRNSTSSCLNLKRKYKCEKGTQISTNYSCLPVSIRWNKIKATMNSIILYIFPI